MDYKIIWTNEAISNLEEILNYLIEKWTQKELDVFKKKLSRQIELISRYPKMFPVSNYNPKLRKAVLSKQTTLYYKLNGNEIFLVYLFVNLKDIKKINR